jgi:hypothetical protein
MAVIHANGTECLKGTQRVPKDFVPCCDSFNRRTKSCHWDNVRIEWINSKRWGILLQDGAYICIEYCPHCGKKL